MKRRRAEDAPPTAAAAAASGPSGRPSLVGLELGALLEEVAAPPSVYGSLAAEGFVALLRAALGALPARDVTADAHEAEHPGLPLRRLAGGAVATLRFAAPTAVAPAGSYASRTLIKPAVCVDVLVTMPASCFRERDVKSFAYADKRAMYLGVLGAALQRAGWCAAVDACALGGDTTKPALLLTPAPAAAAAALAARADRGAGAGDGGFSPLHGGSGGEDARDRASVAKALGKLRVRIIPVLAPSAAAALFPASALTPAWNNVRVSTLLAAGGAGDAAAASARGGAAGAADTPATPHYTAAVSEDVVAGLASDAVAAALAACAPAAAALMAVKAWARRRGLAGRASDAFSSLALSVLVASLVQRGVLLPGMSALQATRAVVHFLATAHLAEPSVPVAGGGKQGGFSGSFKATAVVLSGMSAECAGGSSQAAAAAAAAVEEEEDDDDDDDGGYHTGDSEGMDAQLDESDCEDEEGGGGDAPLQAAHHKRVSLSTEALAAHRAAYDVCVLFHDASTGITANLASRVSASVARELRADAGVLLRALSPLEATPRAAAGHAPEAAEQASSATSAPAPAAGSELAPESAAALFERIFAEPSTPSTRYDRIMVVPLPACPAVGEPPAAVAARKGAAAVAAPTAAGPAPSSSAAPGSLTLAALTDAPTWAHAVARCAAGVLARALTDRVASLRVVPVWPDAAAVGGGDASAGGSPWPQAASLTWPLASLPPPPTCLWVCVAVDPTNAHRNVDRGPAPEAVSAAAAFNSLWGVAGDGRGGLSELRRFADGVIVHAVVWDTAKLGGRVHARDAIVPLIVAHTLNRHVLAAPPPSVAGSSSAGGGAAGKKAHGVASSTASFAGAHAPAGVARLPVSLLHAGDHLCVTPPPPAANSFSATSTASASLLQLLLQADVARAAPSLALERVLDAGGCITATAVVAANAAWGGAPTVTAKLSADSSFTAPAALALPDILSADALCKGPAAAFATAQAAFEALSSALLHARGMPLRVSAVTHASAALRGTSAHAPSPHPLAARVGGAGGDAAADGEDEPAASGAAAAMAARLGGAARKPLGGDALLAAAALAAATAGLAGASGGDALSASQLLTPLPVVATLESSSKWPDDPDAVAALKAAFLLKLKYSLSSGSDGTLPRGSVVAAEARPDGLRVLLGGYCFVVQVHHTRELALLERAARRGPLAARAAAAPPLHGAPPGVVRGFVNVAPAGVNDPEAPLTKKQRSEAAAASGRARIKGSARTQPLAASDGMAVLRAQLGLPAVAAAAAAAAAPASVGGGAARKAAVTAAVDSEEGEEGAAAAAAGSGGSGLSAVDAGDRLDGLYLRCVAAPRHSAAVATLASRFAAYGPTVRLASLWLASAGLADGEGAGGAGDGGMSAAALVPPVAPALRPGAADDALPVSALASSSAGVVAEAYHASLAAAAAAHGGGAGGVGGPPVVVRQELLELLVAHLFTAPGPAGAPPASAACGLLRLLRLLGHHDWLRAPLLVDTDISELLLAAGGEDDAEDVAGTTNRAQRAAVAAAARAAAADSDARTLASRFRAVRAGEVAMAAAGGGGSSGSGGSGGGGSFPPGPAMYVVTPWERGAWRPLWALASPGWPVLGRLVQLARRAEAQLACALAPVLPTPPPLAAAGSSAPQRARRSCFYHGATSLDRLYHPHPQPDAREGGLLPPAGGAGGAAGRPATAAAASPFDIFSGGVDDGGSEAGGAPSVAARLLLLPPEEAAPTTGITTDASLAPYDAVVTLRGAVASRWAVDGRAFGPVKPPVALAAALWHAPRALLAATGVAATSSPPSAGEGAVSGAPTPAAAAAAAAPPPRVQLVVPTAARPHGVRKQPQQQQQPAGGAAAAVGAAGSRLLLPGGLPDGSKLTLPLHRNLLRASREALCVGFEPAACLLGALRARLGAHALFFLQPPHHAATVRALLAAATGGAPAAPAAPPVVGVVWRDAAAGGAGGLVVAAPGGGREPTALALATVPLMAALGAGVVRGVTIVLWGGGGL